MDCFRLWAKQNPIRQYSVTDAIPFCKCKLLGNCRGIDEQFNKPKIVNENLCLERLREVMSQNPKPFPLIKLAEAGLDPLLVVENNDAMYPT